MNPIISMLNVLARITLRLERAMAATFIPRLKDAGRDIYVGRGVRVENPECVSIGSSVFLSDDCWISVVKENRAVGLPTLPLKPELTIGEGTYIGRFGTIACVNRVCIGLNVLISDRVYIGDALHGFLRTDVPVKDQYMSSPGAVIIGDGTWIGIGVSILPNVMIGKNCVIGANSVVTSDVPDFCVAVGNPARIIRCLGESS